MTFLELVQRLRQETHYANTGPTTVVGQSGDHARAVSWIVDAYTELQNRTKWRWLRKEFSLALTSGTHSYASTAANYVITTDDDTYTSQGAISRFKSWAVTDRYNPPRIYLTASGLGASYWLTYLPWEDFRRIYHIGSMQSGAPAHVTIDPSNRLVFGPSPDAAYTVLGEFNRGPQVLSGNTDEPEMPSAYHMLIVYSAMEDGGYFDAADEIVTRAIMKRRRLNRQLEVDQGPTFFKAGAMA